MDNELTKQILFDHFAGRLPALQRSRVEAWLRLPANREQYFAWLEEWERQNLQFVADDERALLNTLRQIDEWARHRSEPAPQPLTVRRNRFGGRWLNVAVAAVVTLCLLAGLYASRSYWLYRTLETGFGEVRRVTLPDGSIVTLNAHSFLHIPRFGFGERSRVVRLAGEATFSVRHLPGHQPFVVQTPTAVEVVVLGTEFNVYARPRGTQVVLRKGRVQLTYHRPAQPAGQLLMQPGDLVRFDEGGEPAIRHGTRTDVVTAWHDHRFVFEQTSMAEIADLLRENYNLTVRLKAPSLAARTVSGSFRAASADELVQVLAQLLEINYSRQQDIITFFE